MMMNTIKINKNLILALMILLSACHESVTDFGFDGQISGMILDQNGKPVSGDVSNPSFTVFILGEQDRVPMEMRVNGDGSYANLHLYPQSYTLWVDGPVDGPKRGELAVDLKSAPVKQNITVTPFLVIPEPTVNVSGGSLNVNYEINPSQGHETKERVVFVSTVAKVGINTGNGPRWLTRRVTLPSDKGTVPVVLDADLLFMAKTRGSGKLFIRIAGRSDKTTKWNYSIPVEITAP